MNNHLAKIKSHVVLGVTASIAAYKAAELASLLTKSGVDVDVVLTREARRFITPLTFSTLTRRTVAIDDHEETLNGQSTHLGLADHADMVVVAPATANVIAQYAHGLAPDVLTCTLLATLAPVIVAPAMNGKMWLHPATQDNVRLLKKRGVIFIGPDSGRLACGYEGKGRLAPVDQIAAAIIRALRKKQSRRPALSVTL